ncbi:aminopeptidase [Actinobaculum suis]|uniref:alpha/beta fold hydrolase n=1 Tax=Actinobaculum suis TaxID=1657 RepID=UPI00066FE06C|nr:alpha/beta fold hydrolase [Actinobaculum suis]KMY23853.1 aminopeptidase [Actinobaculum suis]
MTRTTKQLGNLSLEEIRLTVPLTTQSADKRTIEIFARIVTRPGGENLPYLFFLQGGPGSEAPRPAGSPLTPSWLETALTKYRVVMVDQRGTGLSTPVNDAILETGTAEQVAEYMSHLRADGIVRDCEALRTELGAEKINLLGQSFGGFTTLHYLTVHPESIDQAYFTGGLSAIDHSADDVYSLTYEKMRWLSENYYRRFPEHRAKVRDLVARAGQGEIVLPDGEVVSESRLRSIGHVLGMNDGWLSLYYLLEKDPQSNAFRYDLAAMLPYGGRNPIYYVMHESSYADGVVTNWSAERCLPEQFREDPTLLTGEHVFSQWSDTVPAFQPWKEVTQLLATWQWPKLYDAAALRNSAAQGAAAVYFHDAYVPVEYSLETAANLPGVKLFISSENEHNGLRTGRGEVLRHLFELADGTRVR